MANGIGTPQKTDVISKHQAELVKEITAAMKRDGIAWAAGWKECWSPINATSGSHYRGINRLFLAAAMHKKNLKDPRWCTFTQIKKAGWKLKAGSHTTGAVEFWSWYVRTDVLGSTRLITKEQAERIANELIASSRCPLKETEVDEAFYRPATDEIIVPLREQFHSIDAFTRTILHEMCHSTAKAVGREVGHGLTGYAFEELSAELGSIFAAADAGLNIDTLATADMGSSYLENHAAYLNSWLAAIKDRPAILARAAAEGSRLYR